MTIGNVIARIVLIIKQIQASEKIGKQNFEHGVQEVVGSNPATQTKPKACLEGRAFLLEKTRALLAGFRKQKSHHER